MGNKPGPKPKRIGWKNKHWMVEPAVDQALLKLGESGGLQINGVRVSEIEFVNEWLKQNPLIQKQMQKDAQE